MNRRLVSTLVAALLLAIGIGASGALAGDDNPQPAPPPVSCASLAPGGDESDAANAVTNAAENVGEEAEDEQGDDEQGDQAQGDDDDQGEQGDCDDDDQGEDH